MKTLTPRTRRRLERRARIVAVINDYQLQVQLKDWARRQNAAR